MQLIFTQPGHTVSGDRLAQPPASEIFRGAVKADGSPDNKSFRLVYTIPGTLAGDYASQGKMQFTDPLPAEELRAHPGSVYAYRVRTRASSKKDSADSNTVTVKVYPVAARITSLQLQVTQNAIELSWPPPAFDSGANVDESLAGYHVYRGEPDPTTSMTGALDLSQVKWKSPPALLASAPGPSFQDAQFEFGKTYIYSVRSVVTAAGNPIESDDSAPEVVTPRDTFPPAVPQNVVAVEIPAANGAVSVDLSWAINVETDLAGYRAYRSEQQGARGPSLQVELLASPAYRDTAVQSGHRYWYVVTAVDRAGNESGGSEPVEADLTQPLP